MYILVIQTNTQESFRLSGSNPETLAGGPNTWVVSQHLRDTKIDRFLDFCGSGEARQSLSHQLVPPLEVELPNQE